MPKTKIDKLNKLLWPTTIIIASFILGGFLYASQVSKQKSIEQQQKIKIENENKTKETRKKELESCLEEAKKNTEEKFNTYCILDNKEILEDGSCYLSRVRVDYLNERHDEAKDVCFRKYPQK